MNPIDLPQTPLQMALQGADAAALLRAHTLGLQLRRQQLLQCLLDGVAPADYAHGQALLSMCDAALRVLHTLSPATAAVPTGPAAALPRLPLPA